MAMDRSPPFGDIRQTAYRIYRDDGSLQAASPLGAENTATAVALGQVFRARIEIKNNEPVDSFVLNALLEYSVNSGDWEPCTTSSAVQIVGSAYFEHGRPDAYGSAGDQYGRLCGWAGRGHAGECGCHHLACAVSYGV
jgi:hypothetical protein